MHRPGVVMAVTIAALFFSLHAFSWGIDELVHDGPVTCFDADYAMDGTMFVVFQKSGGNWPICYASSSDHGHSWDHGGCLLDVGHRLEKVRVLVREYDEQPALYVFYVRNGTPSMTRLVLGDAWSLESRSIYWRASQPFDFDVAMASMLPGWWRRPTDSIGEGQHEFALLFVYRELHEAVIRFLRSVDGGHTWEEVHTIDDAVTYGRSAGLSCTWAPPSTFLCVRKKYKPEQGGCDEPPDDDFCYTAYLARNDINGAAGYWSEAWVIELGWIDEDGYTHFAHAPMEYQDPQLAMAFDYNHPTIWAMFHEVIGRAMSYGWTGDEGWEYYRERGGCWSDAEAYRVLGNQYVNFAYVRESWEEGQPNNCVEWSWSDTGEHRTYCVPNGDCVNDHDTHVVARGVGPQLVYSPGSETGGSGIVYLGYVMEEGSIRPGLYFDAPWFYPVDAFERPGEIYTSDLPEPETSEHPMTAGPEEIRGLDIRESILSSRVTVSATSACTPDYSHELTVCWSTDCATAAIRVEGPDGLLVEYSPDERTGCETFHIDLPAGGTVTVTFTARSTFANCQQQEVRTITLPPC